MEYDRWFDEHAPVYQGELQAVGRSIPSGTGLEVGVGTGRFSTPLGIRFGIEPSRAMAEFARRRGIRAAQALGERLPFRSGEFDYLLLVTVICFVESPQKQLREARRVLRYGGRAIVAFIGRERRLGRIFESQSVSDIFYRVARFSSVAEVVLDSALG
jgi:SAM-dependent methyltransferase